MSFSISNIKLGSPASKKYSRNMNFDNNTTMPFGFVQPLMSQRLEANSDISLNLKQVVRLAPMPLPTFGRMKMVNKAVYVPITDVLPYYEALLKGQPYKANISGSSYVPTTVPYTDNATLQYYLLSWSFVSIYEHITSNTNTHELIDPVAKNYDWKTAFMKSVFGATVSQVPISFVLSDKENYVSFDGADYIVKLDQTHYACFRYSQPMRNLRSIFVGLGYGLDIKNKRNVSILPLLCFYKAYFDTYAPKRQQAWTDTYCFAFIEDIEDNYKTVFTGRSSNFEAFYSFLTDLRDCYYVSPDDFVSVHRNQPVTSEGDASLNILDSNGQSTAINVPTTDITAFDNTILTAIKRLSRYVNKDSVIGTKMTDWLRVHFGADVANSLYKDVYQVGTFDFPLNVKDIFATADTAVTVGANKGDGELLGAYAGLGLGDGQSHVKFHSPYAGYFFILSTIVPVSGFNQGDQADLYLLDNNTIPNPDFDALGYELSPMSLFVDHNSIDIPSESPVPFNKQGFGFVPRYSSLKVRRNIANGDISRRGTIASLSPYHLDRNITTSVVTATPKALNEDGTPQPVNGKIQYDLSTTTHLPPSASEQWRYLCKYPFMGNFNRIFHNSGNAPQPESTDSQQDFFAAPIDDNFIVQSLFEVTVTDFLKPLSESWDTIDENDTATKDVQPD